MARRRPIPALLAFALCAVAAAQTPAGFTPAVFPTKDLVSDVVVQLAPGRDPSLFAAVRGLTVVRPLRSGYDRWVFRAATVPAATEFVRAARGDRDVLDAWQDALVVAQKYDFVPNDPLYAYNFPAGQDGQWHLRNTNSILGGTADANVWPAWQADVTGTGVTIGILDDAVQIAHPDLTTNVSLADSYDFPDNDADPSPVLTSDEHGTSVAGVAAARGGNGIGVTGAAPFARIGGIRLPLGRSGLASNYYDAVLFRSSGGTRTMTVKNHSYGFSTSYYDTSQSAALAISADAGTIHLWAAGNSRPHPQFQGLVSGTEGSPNEDANKVGPTNSPNCVVVAACGPDGKFSYYSSYGASIAVTAPSNHYWFNASNQIIGAGITTTDRTGSFGYNGITSFPDYTNQFGGTSSAAPLVSGVTALVKQVQPALDTRFFKHLLARTSRKTDPTNAEWVTNAANVNFNPNYGFGLIDAGALVTQAQQFTGVTPLVTTDVAQQTVNLPLSSSAGVTRTFQVSSTTRLEDVLVTINATHPASVDQLEATLTSPSGTVHRVMKGLNWTSGGGTMAWTFDVNGFWGENPAGTWTLNLKDSVGTTGGNFTSFSVRLRQGTLVQAAADNAELVSENVQTTLVPGAPYSFAFRFRNTGTTTWTRTDAYRLSIFTPTSGLRWPSVTAQMPSTGVAPGATVDLTLAGNAPTTPGRYGFFASLNKRGVRFGQTPTERTIDVGRDYDSTFTSWTLPSAVTRGATFTVPVTFRNTGLQTWQRTEVDVRSTLGSRWGRSKQSLPRVVAPGGSVTVNLQLTAPTTAGTFDIQWQLARNGVLFGAPATRGSITVQ